MVERCPEEAGVVVSKATSGTRMIMEFPKGYSGTYCVLCGSAGLERVREVMRTEKKFFVHMRSRYDEYYECQWCGEEFLYKGLENTWEVIP